MVLDQQKKNLPTPLYGYGRSPRPDRRTAPKNPPKVAPMDGAFWSTVISKITFPKKYRVVYGGPNVSTIN